MGENHATVLIDRSQSGSRKGCLDGRNARPKLAEYNSITGGVKYLIFNQVGLL